MTLERVKAEQIVIIDKMQVALKAMHKKVSGFVTKNRARQLRAHYKQTNIVQPSFTVGDFVLVRRAQDKGHKLSLRSMGPIRVTNVVSELVYDVTKLDGSTNERVREARLRFYRSGHENTVVPEQCSS